MNKPAICLLSCLLAGFPPSETEIREALERKNELVIRGGEKLQGKDWAARMRQEAKVYSVKLTACKPEGNNAYRCAVEVDWATALAPRHTIAMEPLVARTSQGWTVP